MVYVQETRRMSPRQFDTLPFVGPLVCPSPAILIRLLSETEVTRRTTGNAVAVSGTEKIALCLERFRFPSS